MTKPAARQIDDTDDPGASTGKATSGSADVAINGVAAMRVGDGGICNGHAWITTAGAASVVVNGRPLCTQGAETSHPSGAGKLLGGSMNVLVDPSLPRLDKLSRHARARKQMLFTALNPARIAAVLRDPTMLVSFALRDAATYGAHRLGFLALGDAWPKVFGSLATTWVILRDTPFIGDFLRSAESLAANFFDTMAYWITGQMIGFNDAPPGNVPCRRLLPITQARILLRASGSSSQYPDFLSVPHRGEITWQIESLLEEIAPVVFEFIDDSPSISIATMLDHGEWGGDDKKRNLDMHDETHDPTFLARERKGPYLHAWKLDDRHFVVGAGFLRAMSYWGAPHPDNELVLEHEGDGEHAYLVFQVDEIDVSEGEPRLGRARPVRVLAGAHGHDRVYDWDKLNVIDRRVRLTIARGSHAISIVEGRQQASPRFPFNADYHAGPNTQGCSAGHSHLIADEVQAVAIYGADVTQYPLTWLDISKSQHPEIRKRDLWGYEEGGYEEALWGKKQAFPKAIPSPVWGFAIPASREEGEEARIRPSLLGVELLPVGCERRCENEKCPVEEQCLLDSFKSNQPPLGAEDLEGLRSYAEILGAFTRREWKDAYVY